MRGGLSQRLVVALPLVVLGAGAGCSNDECGLGEAHCEGDVLVSCEQASCHDPSCLFGGDGNRWSRESCSDTCVAPNGHPFCALSSESDPGCVGSRADRGYCDGAVAVDCWMGFAKFRGDCSQSGRLCVTDDIGVPRCVLSEEEDPRCLERITTGGAFCDGQRLLECNRAFVATVTTCPAACVSPTTGWAFCAASDEPDPRCGDAGRPEALRCPGDSPATCAAGYVECLGLEPDADGGAG